MKNYNLNSKSDMDNFFKDLESETKSEAKKEALKSKYDINCPKCNATIEVPAGKSYCSLCNEEIDLELTFDF